MESAPYLPCCVRKLARFLSASLVTSPIRYAPETKSTKWLQWKSIKDIEGLALNGLGDTAVSY